MGDSWSGLRIREDKPRGIICGPSPVDGAKFEQNGYYFNVNGDCVGMSQTPRKVANPVESDAPTPEPKPDGPVEPEVVVPEPKPDGPIDAMDMNHEELRDLIMGLVGQGYNPTETADHLNHNGIIITRQKVQAIIRKNK